MSKQQEILNILSKSKSIECVYYDEYKTEKYSSELMLFNNDVYDVNGKWIGLDNVLALRDKESKDIVYHDQDMFMDMGGRYPLTGEQAFNKILYKQKMVDSVKDAKRNTYAPVYINLTCLYFDERTGSIKQTKCFNITDTGLDCKGKNGNLAVPLDKVYGLVYRNARGAEMLYENKSVVAQNIRDIRTHAYDPLNRALIDSIKNRKITLNTLIKSYGLDELIKTAKEDIRKDKRKARWDEFLYDIKDRLNNIKDRLNDIRQSLGFRTEQKETEIVEETTEMTEEAEATQYQYKTLDEHVTEYIAYLVEEAEKNPDWELDMSIQAAVNQYQEKQKTLDELIAEAQQERERIAAEKDSEFEIDKFMQEVMMGMERG